MFSRLFRIRTLSIGSKSVARNKFRGFHSNSNISASYNRFGGGNQNGYGGNSNQNIYSTILGFLASRNAVYFGVGVAGFCVYNLENAPVTNRLRIVWIPFWLETKIGDYSYYQIYNQYRQQILPSNDRQYQSVTKVMNKLLSTVLSSPQIPENQKQHLSKLDWKINIIQVDPNEVPPNAFILPNGKIFIFSSILPICENEDGLATVLSHELSHQLARHTAENLSKQPLYIGLLLVLYTITGVSWFNDVLLNGMLKMPASREMEIEADHIGCNLMARLCFKLSEAVKFWKRMFVWENKMSARGGYLQEVFSTHPGTERRIHNIEEWMPELRNIQESSGCHEHQFEGFMSQSRNFFQK